eukprot:7248422-Prorocentrum_lima.AAC.1
MVVAEAVEHGLSKADCPEDIPSHTPQLLGLLVEVAVDQLVHEADPEYLVGLDVLVEVLELLIPDLPSVAVKEGVLQGK